MTQAGGDPSAVLTNQRVMAFSPREIFAAFEQPDKLAAWWGPRDFTNTFQQFEFKSGGRWDFIMHGPNGVNYHNENFFRDIQPDTRIVIEHVLKPWFRLTITLAPEKEGHTRLIWAQEFESPEVAEQFRPLAETANEQVLDRLEAVLGGSHA